MTALVIIAIIVAVAAYIVANRNKPSGPAPLPQSIAAA
jgi:hypothetical protein